jgi:DNA adenine methylase
VFERADFERLAKQLADIAGRFVLSINDKPGAREIFARFHAEAVEATYHISTASIGGAKRAGELIVLGPA